ncbi:MAG: phosphatase PAP2 family protein [Prevotella sp.]|nr:phosphatase PAP2 family protein [Prevotella sp.]
MFACASSVLAQQRHGDALDDVLAHVPMATVVAMKLGGVESRHDWTQLAVTAGASYLLSAGVALGLKRGINEWRPDHSDQRSFPSGHTTMAFSGATVLHHEYGHLSPWVSVAGYGVATAVAVDRVARDRHHWYDVAAGAAIGFGCTELCYWASRRLFKSRDVALNFTGSDLQVVVNL